MSDDEHTVSPKDMAMMSRKYTPQQKRKWMSAYLHAKQNSGGNETVAISFANRQVRKDSQKRG